MLIKRKDLDFPGLVKGMLLASHAELIRLGDHAKDKEDNPYNKTRGAQVVGDVASELVAQQVADKWGQENGIKILWVSEELPRKFVGDLSSTRIATVTYDGIDGTDEFMNGRPAGPVGGVLWKEDPRYLDTEAAGTISVSDGWMLLVEARANKATWTELNNGGKSTVLPKFKPTPFDPDRFLADGFTSVAKNMLGPLEGKFLRTGATGVTGLLLALQDAPRHSPFDYMNKLWLGLIADAGDKGNLEQPFLYLTMRVLGGMLVTDQGSTIAAENFFAWSQDRAGVPNNVFFQLVREFGHHKLAMEFLQKAQ